MAYIGLLKPIVAKLTENGDTVTYTNGKFVGEAMTVDVTPEYNEASLYGDDRMVEYIKKFKEATVSLGITRIPNDVLEMMFGVAVSEADGKISYKSTDENPYIGLGVIQHVIDNGVEGYNTLWINKVKFAAPADSMSTQGDNVEFKTPTVEGKAMPIYNYEWKEVKTFATYSEAETYLKNKAGITA